MKRLKKPAEAVLAAAMLLMIVFTAVVYSRRDLPPALVLESITLSSPSSGRDRLLDINRASATELDDLPGIGPALAGRIVTWREENGDFTCAEDILSVSGIGSAKYEAIKPYITY